MTSIEGLFRVNNGATTVETMLINKGGNHCQIVNNDHVLFDGYILEGYKVFEDKAEAQKALADFAGWEFTRIK